MNKLSGLERMTSAPTEPARPLNWNTWLLWVAVCAAGPILLTAAATAFGRLYFKAGPIATLNPWEILFLIMAAFPALALLQWAVLRRMAPKLRWWIWLAGALVTWGIAIVLELKAKELSGAGRQFALAASRMNTYTSSIYPNTLTELLGLPWGRALISTAALAAATMFVPTWIFARAAGIRWHVVLVAAIVGACAAAIVDQVYYLWGFHIDPIGMRQALNGVSWPRRIGELSLRAATGAVWGASSGLVIALLVRRDVADSEPHRSRLAIHGARGLTIMLASILVIAAAAPFLDSDRARVTLVLLRKALSFPPSSDVSEGEQVLRYSHLASVHPTRYSMANFAPDGKSFVTVTADRRLLHIDVETGKSLGTVGDQLGRDERHGLAWSPDGVFLALRTEGEVVRPYTERRARFRIYALPDYKLAGEYSHRAGEYSHRDDECFDSYAQPSMMFELDGRSLWVLCRQYEYRPAPDGLMAIRLEVPSMKVLQLRRYGESAARDPVRGLARIGPSIWYWQHSSGKPEHMWVRDLTRDRDVLYLRDLDQPNFADNFTLQEYRLTETRITLRYHGGPGAPPSIRRWLVLDAQSGRLLEKRDEPNRPTTSVLETSSNLRIETSWQADSKAGVIDVIDSVSGKRRQRLSTLAQRQVGISPDGRWLVMNAFEQRTLRIYRVTP